MAQSRKIPADVGSAVLQELINSFNKLVGLVETATDLTEIQTKLADGTSEVYKITQDPESHLPSGQLVD